PTWPSRSTRSNWSGCCPGGSEGRRALRKGARGNDEEPHAKAQRRKGRRAESNHETHERHESRQERLRRSLSVPLAGLFGAGKRDARGYGPPPSVFCLLFVCFVCFVVRLCSSSAFLCVFAPLREALLPFFIPSPRRAGSGRSGGRPGAGGARSPPGP